MSQRKIRGGVLMCAGYLLSPLSWWNDLLINIPLAYLFAMPFTFLSRDLFLPAMVLGYWLTNVLGFVLMHWGFSELREKENRREMSKDLAISLVYTLLVVILILAGWIQPPEF
ncbi:MAG: hypothetical protein JW727_04990 [Candidatus Aenigmarchaeota archaeon]|nr:hypothetical protein [Candidatus Aenigmarchaeota archaeon]